MNIGLFDVLPYIITVVTCYITIKVCLTRHDLQITQIEKSLDELTKEVKANNEVKLRVTKMESELSWLKRFIEREGK